MSATSLPIWGKEDSGSDGGKNANQEKLQNILHSVNSQVNALKRANWFEELGGAPEKVSLRGIEFPESNNSTSERILERFVPLQEWEGYVLEVAETTFTARLVALDDKSPNQEAEIYLEQVDEGDHWLIEPGAVFYWNIGYTYRPSGKSTTSSLRFRRLPLWSKREKNRKYWVDRFDALFDDE